MRVAHAKVAAGTHDPSKEVSKDDWNDDHTLVLWNGVSSNTTMVASGQYVVDASGGAVTMSLPASIAVGDAFAVRAKGGAVTIETGSLVIEGVGAGNDLGLADGDFVVLVATSTTDLIIVSDALVRAVNTRKVKFKTTATLRNTTTTATDDPHLVCALEAGKTYRISAKLHFEVTSATPDVKCQPAFTGTTNSVINRRLIHAGSSATAQNSTAALAATAPDVSGAMLIWFEYELVLDVNTAGNFSFQWAQNTSNASDVTLHKGSWFEYEEVA